MADKPISHITLRFLDDALFAHPTEPPARNLSAGARAWETLFLACDESAGIDRLRPAPDPAADGTARWAAHERISLASFFTLSAADRKSKIEDATDIPDEMDIESLASRGRA